MTKAAGKDYAKFLRTFPFPKGWARLQSPLHHLKSYKLNEHARWGAIIPGLLRIWLKEAHIEPFFLAQAKCVEDSPVDFIVSTYAAIANSTSLLASDSIEAKDDRVDLAAIVKHARAQFQRMSSMGAGSIQANPRRGSVVGGQRSRSATPMGPPSAPVALLPDVEEDTAPGVAKKGAHQLLQDMKRPNVHTALHYSRTAAEYGPPGLLDVLIGEDKHRYFNSLFPSLDI